jgi:hypothetical protein
MTFAFRTGALALGLIGSAAVMPAPSYAIDGDVELGPAGADIELVRDRPGILGRRHLGPEVYIEETPGPDVYIGDDDYDDDAYVEDDDDDAPPGASVEVEPY